MKRLFIIAMCLLSLGFASCHKDKDNNNENSNEQFIGNFAGEIAINGTIETSVYGQAQSMPLDYKVDIELRITAGNENDEVIANFDMEDQPFSVKGKCKNNHVDFEPYKNNISYEGQQIDYTFNMKGDLDGDTFNVSGDFNATGNLAIEGTPMAVVVKANLSGPLARQ